MTNRIIKAILIWVIGCIPFVIKGQPTEIHNGIYFTTGLSWQQIVEKAKAEKKYIFVDFYATWCAPCKAMDQNVYQANEVGEMTGQHFIAVKIQIDRTVGDNEEVKKWYSDADSLGHAYHVATLPTLLFFSPSGLMICKEEGYKPLHDFIRLINYVTTVSKGYDALIELYKDGNLPYSEMGKLALEVKKFGDMGMADSMARLYKNYYLNDLDDSAKLTRENMWFIVNFPSLIQGGDAFFNSFYFHPSEAEEQSDSRNGFAKDLISFVIYNEEIERHLYKDGKVIIRKPNWKALYRTIIEKYSKQYADEILPDARMRFYETIKNWNKYAADFDSRIKQHPPRPGGRYLGGMVDDVWALNTTAWNLFLHCNDLRILKRALRWSKLSVRLSIEHKDDITQYLDTEANLLYKIGKVNEGILLERQALDLSKNSEDYKTNLAKMRQGSPTWPSE